LQVSEVTEHPGDSRYNRETFSIRQALLYLARYIEVFCLTMLDRHEVRLNTVQRCTGTGAMEPFVSVLKTAAKDKSVSPSELLNAILNLEKAKLPVPLCLCRLDSRTWDWVGLCLHIS
jgi:hypothetical protein